jgi:hypothetical protein
MDGPASPLREPFAKASPLGEGLTVCLTQPEILARAPRLKPPSMEDPQGMPFSLDAFFGRPPTVRYRPPDADKPCLGTGGLSFLLLLLLLMKQQQQQQQLLVVPTVVPADVADPARLSFVVPPGAHVARAMVPSTRTLNAARSAGGPREESKRGVLTGDHACDETVP